ncbi:Flagellar biosynthesis protein FlhF [Stratiformator vulcanicus]|uniref:Flagellar biosynthesis protein FlhF n=2 Tax=Stratiformator vulcanicus TaxID=2527980 RepID=A0A517QVW0_9PLAN|nr:Flagellar biosynthesis protein FlhF [Stratiformator vulcanicus]
MQDALDRVKREMGSDAVILNTREVPARKRLLSFSQPKAEVEITAGLGITTKAAARRTPPRRRPAPAMTIQERKAVDIVREIATQNYDSPLTDGRWSETEEKASPETTSPVRPQRSAAPAVDQTDALANRLDIIQRALERIERERRFGEDDQLDETQTEVYEDLIQSGVDHTDARRLVTTARSNPNISLREAIHHRLGAEIRCGGSIEPVRGQRKVVALVGPTGVGKTTTIAKLAADLKMRGDVSMGLVTVDTYRVAAVEQLKTYAEIIDLPMRVVADRSEMRDALEDLADVDLIFIDTAGRSPRDARQIDELRDLLNAADVDEVHLVVSVAASRRALLNAVDQFRRVGVTHLVASKLDEADGAGGIVTLCRHSGLPLSYFTTGQNVPDDFETATSDAAANAILPLTPNA